MVEACFNELSIFPCCNTKSEAEERIATFVALLNEIKKLGVKHVRYEGAFEDIIISDSLSLADYCKNASTNDSRNRAMLLYAMMRRPYLDENKEVLFCQYDNCKWCPEYQEEQDCLGLYIAKVTNSFAVGFHHNDACLTYNNCKLRLQKGSGNEEHYVCCLTKPEHIDLDLFVELMSRQEDLVVPICEIAAGDKTVHIPSHHGAHDCKVHAEKLLNNKYIKAILNSIDFNPGEKNYIHLIKEPNIIEIRLTWTKGGYGLCIATTATNRAQNHWIARHLELLYSR